jgi:hypothetical protein
LISQHGAGLANIIFMRPGAEPSAHEPADLTSASAERSTTRRVGASLAELDKVDNIFEARNYYQHLAAAIGLRHQKVSGRVAMETAYFVSWPPRPLSLPACARRITPL